MNIQLFENSDRKLCYVKGQKGYMNNAKKKFYHSKFTFCHKKINLCCKSSEILINFVMCIKNVV